MPIRVADLINKRKEIPVEWEGDVVNVAYRPYSHTLEETAKAAVEADGKRGPTIEQLKLLLVGWDIQGEDGKVAAIDYETLDVLPSPLLTAIHRAIVESMYPNRKSGASTAAG